MTKHRRILNTIAQIRNAHESMEGIFLYGACMNLFCILRSIHPEAKSLYNGDHIITKIGNYAYDITGVVDPKDYMPFTQTYDKKRKSRAFMQMYRHN